MSDTLRDLLGTIFFLVVGMGPLALSRRARVDYGFAIRISIVTYVILIPLVYVGTALQAPPQAIDRPVTYLLTGYAFFLGAIAASNLLWRFLVMPRFKKNG